MGATRPYPSEVPVPEPPPLRQLLDRQEIMAAMAAYARCADLPGYLELVS